MTYNAPSSVRVGDEFQDDDEQDCEDEDDEMTITGRMMATWRLDTFVDPGLSLSIGIENLITIPLL